MSVVRLAYNPQPHAMRAWRHEHMTEIRLACADGQAERNGSLEKNDARPSLLVSYAYLEPFLKRRSQYAYRDWVLDSGAFTAHAQGKPVDVMAYGEKALELLAGDDPPVEVFSLDVIGDWKASAANVEKLWEMGVPAIPAYHVGSPEPELLRLAATFPKIALGGAVGYRKKLEWAQQCFARVWPKRIHGFGFGSEKAILSLPWHSVDATNWEIGPCKYGSWRTYGRLSVRGSKQDLRGEIAWYLDLERKARARWKKQMAELDAAGAPTISMAMASSWRSTSGVASEALKGEPAPAPTVRLVGMGNPNKHFNGLVSGDYGDAGAPAAPNVRLAADFGAAAGQRIDRALEPAEEGAPSIRLATHRPDHKGQGLAREPEESEEP